MVQSPTETVMLSHKEYDMLFNLNQIDNLVSFDLSKLLEDVSFHDFWSRGSNMPFIELKTVA